MLTNKLKRLFELILNSSYKKSEPLEVLKRWRTITDKLVSEKFFAQAGLYNVWKNYPGKRDRQIVVVQCLQNVIAKQMAGIVAEFGCFKGHTAIQMVHAMEKLGDTSKLFLFDSFQGVPDSNSPDDWHLKKGDLTVEYSEVKDRFAPYKNIEVVKGYFKDVLPQYDHLKIKFAHVDVDLYVSIKEVNTWLLSRMITGGIIIYDDYGFETCPGALKAVDEDFSQRLDYYKWSLPTGQFMALKIP